MRVAITGGSGSLGRTLIARLAREGADRIVTFSRDEQKRAELHREFGWHPGFRVMAGDVRDAARLVDLFHGCEAVVHAAARKVVTSHPDEPEEMLKTNVLGTLNVIEAARRAGATKVLVVSSDKAVRAENCYGMAKALMEQLAVAANARLFPQGCRVGVIRYGNVLGSRGSVLPLWRARQRTGLPIQVSDVRMTRFWLTLAQAAEYVLAALANLRGGEVVVPDLPAAPVALLAQVLDPNWSADPTGIRPGGEKLHEELLSASEVRRTVRRNGLFLVPPFQHDEMWDARPWVGERVEEDMIYRSDVWRQLTPAEMQALVAEAEA